MPPRGFPHPTFQPVDLTDVRSPDELKVQLELANESYLEHLENVRHRQKQWAFRMMPFLQDDRSAAMRALAQRRIASDEHWVRYQALDNVSDSMLPNSPLLFTYSNEERITDQVRNGGLRVSGGAAREFQHQRGTFPKGPYGTTIPPFDADVSVNAMRREFFDVEYSLPSVPTTQQAARDALPMSHFIMFASSTSFSSKGHLEFSRIATAFRKDFEHYALPTPDLNPGQFLPYDIIAYGRSLIAEDIPGTQIARNNTGEGRVPVQVSAQFSGRSA